MSSELIVLLRQQSKIGPINVPRAAMRDAAARIEALEAEVARKDAALASILGLIGNVEHKGGGANAARMYADMLNDIRVVARRTREGGNDV